MKTTLVVISAFFCLSLLQGQDSFVIHTNINSQLSSKVLRYDTADYITDPTAKFMTTVASPYVEKTLPEEWDSFRWLLDSNAYDYKTFRNNMIAKFSSAADWDALNTVSKQALVRHYIWKSTETTANLDLLYTQAERDEFREAVIVLLNECDCNLQISPNNKLWNVLPDNAGLMAGTEVKTDETIQ